MEVSNDAITLPSLLVVAFACLLGLLGKFDDSFPAFSFVYFFFKVEISSRTQIPLFFFRPGSVYSGLASWNDFGRVFLDELRVSSFPDRFPHYAWTACQPTPTSLSQGCMRVQVFRCNLPPALLAE